MNLAKSKSKYLKCAILIISICILLGALSACLPFNISSPDTLDKDAIDNAAATITTNSTDGLGEFNDGYSYVYTDKDLIDDFRAGNPNTPYDVSVVKVDMSQARGTQKNPYVITSIEDWDRFARNLDDNSIPSYGSGKYFVLANDIDFDGKDFHPIRFFNGTFYGLGNSLKNITHIGNDWQYWDGKEYVEIPISGADAPLGYGVFCRTVNAVISDLIVERFNYREMLQTAVETVHSRSSTNTGGIIGLSYGTDVILNCHTIGDVYSDIAYNSHVVGIGGLVGARTGAKQELYMYRCSSEVTISTKKELRYPAHGGLVGDTYGGGTLYIYDCAAKLISYTDSASHTSAAAAVALISGNALYMENFEGYIDVNSTNVAAGGSLFGIYSGGSVPILKNCYIEGLYGAEDNKYAFAGVGGSYAVTVNNSTIGNINVVKPTDKNYWTSYSGSYTIRLSGHKEYATSDLMCADAKTFFGNNFSQIWDVDKIGGLYDPENSPVRNYLLAFVSYRNLTNGGNSEESVGIEDEL
ncbi:MAG: hypothetical protein K2H24_03500, partial [Clostridia bacterium]|nr:hypothetical protein [Clostridia bacterium]